MEKGKNVSSCWYLPSLVSLSLVRDRGKHDVTAAYPPLPNDACSFACFERVSVTFKTRLALLTFANSFKFLSYQAITTIYTPLLATYKD